LIDQGADELREVTEDDQWMQPAQQILDNLPLVKPAQRYMSALLNHLERQTQLRRR
jgi:hypothetical protein